ncbi:hypothetical protein MMC25_000436 [Agyrium rufum]|nr:hypothetical protein [Agyrium rufum]
MRNTPPPHYAGPVGNSSGRGPPKGKNKFVPLKGLFADGVWKCNCEPRLPAERFKTNNGGKNHGRWFYTCQKPQHQRCNFFLWDDEAKSREAMAVLHNTRSEEEALPKPAYPLSHTIRSDSPEIPAPYTPSKPPRSSRTATQPPPKSTENFYDWSSSDNEEMIKAADEASKSFNAAETPRKAMKTEATATPRKRAYEEMAPPMTPRAKDEDVFTTPSNSVKRPISQMRATGLMSPITDPTPSRFRDAMVPENSPLSAELLASLHEFDIAITAEAIAALKSIANKFTLRTQGIAKGRDITRLALQTKDAKIAELQGKITAFETERETNRTVIAHLKKTLAMALQDELTPGKSQFSGDPGVFSKHLDDHPNP